MTNIELKRNHEGTVHLFVNGVPALGAEFTGISNVSGKQSAVIVVPLDQLSFGEQSVVVPFPVVERRRLWPMRNTPRGGVGQSHPDAVSGYRAPRFAYSATIQMLRVSGFLRSRGALTPSS